ncbi:MAG: class I SAM-dependent methyltransferase [Ignavibacteriales bacterium]
MEPNQVSRTAFMTAYLRGYHAIYGNPKIFDDNRAWGMIPEQVKSVIEQHLAESARQMAPGNIDLEDHDLALRAGVEFMAGAILARARYAEDLLAEAIQQGAKQYIVLGAGLDTFALRRQDLMEQLQVFELDHPSTQELKHHMLIQQGISMPDNLHFVPVDFAVENLKQVMGRTSFDPQSLSFFSWLGVTHYLPLEAIFSTLSNIAEISAPATGIVFDYWDKAAFDPSKSSRRIKSILENTQRIGEPITTGFDPSTLKMDLANLGLLLNENLGPAAIRQRYFGGRSDGYSASDHVNYAYATVQERQPLNQ